MFDYDRDVMQPPEPREELDLAVHLCWMRTYRYVGDEV